MAGAKEQIMDVRSVVEAVTAAGDDVEIDTPLYVVESLCMRCGENVRKSSVSFLLLFLFSVLEEVFLVYTWIVIFSVFAIKLPLLGDFVFVEVFFFWCYLGKEKQCNSFLLLEFSVRE